MHSLFPSRHLNYLSSFGVLASLLMLGCSDDGKTPIIESQEANEAQCTHGGTIIETGFDTTDNGEIDDKIDQKILCHPRDCSSEHPLDFELQTESLPDQLAVDMDYEIDVISPERNLDIKILDISAVSLDMDIHHDSESNTITLTPRSETDPTELAILATDGCQVGTDIIEIGPIDNGYIHFYLAHLLSDVGPLQIIPEGENTPIATVDPLDVSEPSETTPLFWGSHNLEIFDDQGTHLTTFHEVEFDPLQTYMAYLSYADDEPTLQLMTIDLDSSDDTSSRLRVIHGADGPSALDFYLIDVTTGEQTPIFEGIASDSATARSDFPATSNTYIGADSNGDGNIDLSYTSTFEFFDDGTTFDLFTYVGIESDELWLLSFDYEASDSNPVTLHQPGVGPRIDTSPKSLNFNTLPGTSDHRFIQINNDGFSPLEIEDISIAQGSDAYSISFFDTLNDNGQPPPPMDDSLTPPDVIEEGSPSVYMRVHYHPEDTFPVTPDPGEIVIQSNSSQNSELSIELIGNEDNGCISVSDPFGIDFGVRSTQQENRHFLTIENCSDHPLEIDDIYLSDDDTGYFDVPTIDQLEDLSELPGILDPREIITVPISFSPLLPGPSSGEFVIENSASPNQEFSLPLLGEGIDAECPIAHATATVNNSDPQGSPLQASPQDVVHFDAQQSTSPNSASLDYMWEVIHQPWISQTSLTVSESSTTEFEIDAVGDYLIQLTVTDQELRNCESHLLHIEALPEGDVHIEFAWRNTEIFDTYGSPRPEDNIGTDLNLHFVRPGGSWGSSNDSIYYDSPTQDWTGDGQPNIFLQDSNSYGTKLEQIAQWDPENGGHPIGIHYYDARDYGPTTATVRVFFGTILIDQRQRILDSTDHFWYVGDIAWGDQPTFELIDGYATSHLLNSANDGVGGF